MTQYTPFDSILTPPRRQRKTFDETSLQELRASIQESEHGLLQAPVLRADADKLWLVAGERRLRAIKDIYDLGGTFRYNGTEVPAGMVPYTTLGDLSPADAWEAELEENIRRVDLTWAERAAATAEWAAMRKSQAAERNQPAPTVREIADEVKVDLQTPQARIDTTRKELIVSRHLSDPDVAAATSLSEAFKVVKKKEEAAALVNLAATVGKTFSGSAHTLLNEDARVWAKGALDSSFDIILSDPPYGMGADQFGDSGQEGTAAHRYDDSYETWQNLMRWFLPETWRLAKPNAAMYLFCDIDRFHELRELARSAGWTPFRTPIIWHNSDGFRAPWPERGPQRKYECILYALKGDFKVNHLLGDVLPYRRDASLGHPAQKPVPLLVDLLRRVAKPGYRVLDAFAGSGSTLEAAHEVLCFCTAIEQDPQSFAIAAKRLAAINSQPALL